MVSRGILRKASASKTFQVGSVMFSIGGRGRLMKIVKIHRSSRGASACVHLSLSVMGSKNVLEVATWRVF